MSAQPKPKPMNPDDAVGLDDYVPLGGDSVPKPKPADDKPDKPKEEESKSNESRAEETKADESKSDKPAAAPVTTPPPPPPARNVPYVGPVGTALVVYATEPEDVSLLYHLNFYSSFLAKALQSDNKTPTSYHEVTDLVQRSNLFALIRRQQVPVMLDPHFHHKPRPEEKKEQEAKEARDDGAEAGVSIQEQMVATLIGQDIYRYLSKNDRRALAGCFSAMRRAVVLGRQQPDSNCDPATWMFIAREQKGNEFISFNIFYADPNERDKMMALDCLQPPQERQTVWINQDVYSFCSPRFNAVEVTRWRECPVTSMEKAVDALDKMLENRW